MVNEGKKPRDWVTGKTAMLLSLAVLAAALQVLGAYLQPGAWGRFADLHVYYGAVSALRDNGTLYDFTAVNGDPFTYPPFAGLVLLPLLLVPETLAGAMWTVLTLLSVAIAAWVIAARTPVARFRLSPVMRAAIVASLLLVSAPLSSNIRFGQVSWLLVVLIGADALTLTPARYRGIATGVAAAIKLTPLVFVAYYWCSGRRRDAVIAAVTFTACSSLAWLVLPGDSARFWFTAMWDTSRIGNLAMGGNQSLNGMFLRIGVLGEHVAPAVLPLSALVLALGVWRASRAARNGHELVGLAIMGAAAIAASPVSWTHHQVWLVIAAAASFGRTWITVLWRVGLVVIMCVSVGPFISHVMPAVSFLTDNLRGLFAVAIAAALPFAETKSPAGLRVLHASRWRVPGQSARDAAPSAHLLKALLVPVILLSTTGCQVSEPDVVRPSGQALVAVIGNGRVGSIQWRTEVVRIDGKLCTQAVVSRKIMGNECGPLTVDGERPINFTVEGNAAILFVHGIAAPVVAKLQSITVSQLPIDLAISTVQGQTEIRYFGYAVVPGDAVDLLAFDQSGTQIYSGGAKIRSTRDGDDGSPQTQWPPSPKAKP